MGRFKFIKKHPETVNFDMLIPLTFVIGLLFLLLCGLISMSVFLNLRVSLSINIVSGLLTAVYAVYLVIILAGSLYISLKNGFRYFKYLPFIFFTIHLGLGCGFLGEILRFTFVGLRLRLSRAK
jgi:hypothetical protein